MPDKEPLSRRQFIKFAATSAAAVAIGGCSNPDSLNPASFVEIFKQAPTFSMHTAALGVIRSRLGATVTVSPEDLPRYTGLGVSHDSLNELSVFWKVDQTDLNPITPAAGSTIQVAVLDTWQSGPPSVLVSPFIVDKNIMSESWFGTGHPNNAARSTEFVRGNNPATIYVAQVPQGRHFLEGSPLFKINPTFSQLNPRGLRKI